MSSNALNAMMKKFQSHFKTHSTAGATKSLTESFNKQVDEMSKEIEISIAKLPAELQDVFLQKVVLDTLKYLFRPGGHPVDTGRSRGGWLPFAIEKGQESAQTTEEAEGAKVSSFSEKIFDSTNFVRAEITLTNGVFYTIFLEEGTNKMPARHMMQNAMKKAYIELNQ